MTYINQAKDLVRNAKGMEHLKELSFGCEVFVTYAIEDPIGEWNSMSGIYLSKVSHSECAVLLSDVYSDDLPEGEHSMVIETPIRKMEIIGHEPTGFDYLKVLGDHKGWSTNYRVENGKLKTTTFKYVENKIAPIVIGITFNLIGDPLDEENAKKFIELVTK